MTIEDKTDNDFISSWEKKKKENDAIHKRAYNKMKDLWCVFSGKKKGTE